MKTCRHIAFCCVARRDGLKAIDVEAAAAAQPSYMATALDIGDIVFKYSGSAGVKGVGTAGFEPVVVELIEEFETEKGDWIVCACAILSVKPSRCRHGAS